MVQNQNGRLHFNWLGEVGGPYPHYETVRSQFGRVLDQFIGFIAQEQAGDFRPNQWEVTYLNHIPQGTVWNNPIDWSFFRPLGEAPPIVPQG